MNFKELLIKLNACQEGIEWMGDRSIEQYIKDADRGDWLLWLAKRVEIPLQQLTLAKGHCAETVLHLMKDERSKEAVRVAIRFGEGNATKDELDAASAFTSAASDDAASAFAASAASAAAADAADAFAASAAAASAAAAAAADAFAAAAAAAAYYADAYAASADARKNNQMLTADICRKYIGDILIDKINELLK